MAKRLSDNMDLPLTESQKTCVDYYLSHRPYSYTAAYRACFPNDHSNPNTVRSHASEVFNNPRVKKYKEERLQKIYEEANINAEAIAIQLASIAYDDDKERTGYALKALDLLQKQLGLQTKNQNINADVSSAVQIVEDLPDEADKTE